MSEAGLRERPAAAAVAAPRRPAPQPTVGPIAGRWFPPTANTLPLPVEVITTGSDPGVNGWYPPSRAHPLPVQIVSGTPPAVNGWYPPSWSNPLPVTQITGGAAPGGDETYFPPSTDNPLPVVVITTGADPQVTGWRPPSYAFPLPVVMV